jgi:hypothetical protein
MKPELEARLISAIETPDINALENLINKEKISINAPLSNGRYPIHHAIVFRNIEIVVFLAKNSTDINSLEVNGKTPLAEAIFQFLSHCASYKQNKQFTDNMSLIADIIKFLLLKKANPNIFLQDEDSSSEHVITSIIKLYHNLKVNKDVVRELVMLLIYCEVDIPLDIPKNTENLVEDFFLENYIRIQYFHDQCNPSHEIRNLPILQKNSFSNAILKKLPYKITSSALLHLEKARGSHQKRKAPFQTRIVVEDAVVPKSPVDMSLSSSQEVPLYPILNSSSENIVMSNNNNFPNSVVVPQSPFPLSYYNFENVYSTTPLAPDITSYDCPNTTSSSLSKT